MKQFRIFLLRAGIIIGIGILSFQLVDSVSELRSTTQFSPGSTYQWEYLIISLLLVFISFAQYMFAWRVIMNDMGTSLGNTDVIKGFMLTMPSRYIPGTAWGYLSRNEYLFQHYGIKYQKSFNGMVIELLAAFTSSVMVVSTLLFNLYLPKMVVLLSTVAVIVLPISAWMIIVWLHKVVHRKATSFAWMAPNMLTWLKIISLLTINWLLYGLGLLFTSRFFTSDLIRLSVSTIIQYSGIFSTSWFIGFVMIFIPSGIGVREYTLGYLMSQVLPISSGIAGAISITFRLISITAELIWVGIAIILNHIEITRKNN